MCKKRLGFISNSSSSSFILSVKNTDEKIKVEIDLIDFIRNCGEYGDSGLRSILKTKKDVDEFIIERYYYLSNSTKSNEEILNEIFEDEEYSKEDYEEMIKEIEDGKVIITCDIGYDKSETFEILKNNENIKFIQEDF